MARVEMFLNVFKQISHVGDLADLNPNYCPVCQKRFFNQNVAPCCYDCGKEYEMCIECAREFMHVALNETDFWCKECFNPDVPCDDCIGKTHEGCVFDHCVHVCDEDGDFEYESEEEPDEEFDSDGFDTDESLSSLKWNFIQ